MPTSLLAVRGPAPPPPNVPELDEEHLELTLRERLELHRNQPGCVKCHEGIDPWGLPFEEFNAAGLFRAGETVACDSTLPDGTDIENVLDLKTYLANDRLDQLAFSVLKHLSTWATGRTLRYSELENLKIESRYLRESGYRMQDLLQFVLRSDIFLKK